VRPRAAARTTARLALVAGWGVLVWFLVHHTVYLPWHHFFDLGVYRGAVRSWLDGHPLYAYHRRHSHYGFTYPPFAALTMIPSVLVKAPAAEAIATTASVLVVGGTTWWLVAPVARRAGWTPWFAVGLALPLTFLMEPIRDTLGFGQVNLLLVGLVLADVLALQRGRRWAGVGIGLATAVKLTPGVFLLYLALTRRRRAAATAVGAFVAASLLALVVDPRTSVRFWTTTLWETHRVGRLDKTANQSILGVLARLALPKPPDRALWAVLAAAVLVFAMWRAVRARWRGDELAGVTLAGLAGCLVSPVSWTHHLYWVVPAAVVLVDVAVTRAGRARIRAAAGAVVVVGVFCSSLIWYFARSHGNVHLGGALGAVVENGYFLVLLALVAFLPVRAEPASRNAAYPPPECAAERPSAVSPSPVRLSSSG
jgi:alpha-1,2-mannosyltransferase